MHLFASDLVCGWFDSYTTFLEYLVAAPVAIIYRIEVGIHHHDTYTLSTRAIDGEIVPLPCESIILDIFNDESGGSP